MDPLRLALLGILPPAAVAWLCALLLRSGPRARFTSPLALGLGFLAAGLALMGAPPLALDLEFKFGLLPAAVLALGLALVEARRRRSWIAGRLGLALLLPPWLLDFLWRHTWSGWTVPVGFGAISLGLSFVLVLGARAEARAEGAAPWPWLVAGSLSALSLHESGSSTLAQLEGAWVTALAVLWLVDLREPRGGRMEASPPMGTTLLPLLLHALLILGAVFTSELPRGAGLLLVTASLGPCLWPTRRKGLREALPAILLALGAGLGALLWVHLGAPEDPYAAYR